MKKGIIFFLYIFLLYGLSAQDKDCCSAWEECELRAKAHETEKSKCYRELGGCEANLRIARQKIKELESGYIPPSPSPASTPDLSGDLYLCQEEKKKVDTLFKKMGRDLARVNKDKDSLGRIITDRNGTISELNKTVYDIQIRHSKSMEERMNQIDNLKKDMEDLRAYVEKREALIRELENELQSNKKAFVQYKDSAAQVIQYYKENYIWGDSISLCGEIIGLDYFRVKLPYPAITQNELNEIKKEKIKLLYLADLLHYYKKRSGKNLYKIKIYGIDENATACNARALRFKEYLQTDAYFENKYKDIEIEVEAYEKQKASFRGISLIVIKN